MSNESPILPILDRFLSSRLEQVHTCLPGRVETYDPSTRKATVKPLVRLRMEAGPLIDIPPIAGIPVVFPSTSAFSLTYPLASGDSVLLMFSEASLGLWLASNAGAMADAEDSSRFSLTDAICIPGLWPYSAIPTSPNIIDIKDGTITVQNEAGANVVLASSGLMGLSTPSGSVKDLMDDLWAELTALTSDLNAQFTAITALPAPLAGAAFTPMVTALGLRLTAITTKALKVTTILQ